MTHWHIDIRQRAMKRQAVSLKEETCEKESSALVAIWQRMVA